jgi:hypothetical protein
MNFLTHNLLRFEISNLKFEIRYSSDFSVFFFEAFFAAGFSAASVATAFGAAFGAAFFARGAAAAPPRFRPLLSASFAGLAGSEAAGFAPFTFGSGLASLLSEIVT